MIMPSFVFIIKLQIVVSHFLSENLSSSEWRENSNRSRYKSNPSAEMQIRVSFRQRLPRTPLGTSTLKTSFDSYSKMARQTSAGDTPTRHFEPTLHTNKICETQREQNKRGGGRQSETKGRQRRTDEDRGEQKGTKSNLLWGEILESTWSHLGIILEPSWNVCVIL